MQETQIITFKSEYAVIKYYILDNLSTNTIVKGRIALNFSEA